MTPLVANYDAVEAEFMPMLQREAARLRIPGATYEDGLQEARIGLWKAIEDFRPDLGVPFGAFAHLCVTRQVITALKTSTRRKHLVLSYAVRAIDNDEGEEVWSVDLLPGPVADSPDELIPWRLTLAAVVEWARENLSPLERTAVGMKASGYSYEQIAAVSGRSVKALDNANQRAGRKFEGFMEAFDAGLIPDVVTASEHERMPMSTQAQNPEIAAVTAALEKLAKLHRLQAQLPGRIAEAEGEFEAAVQGLGFPIPGLRRSKAASAAGAKRPMGPIDSDLSRAITAALPASRDALVERTRRAANVVGSILSNLERHGLVERVPGTDPPVWRSVAAPRPVVAVA